MTIRQLALLAALIPAMAFAAYVPGTNTTWNASGAAAKLLAANGATTVAAIRAAAGSSVGKLAGLTITSVTSVPSGPEISGQIVATLTSSAAALADPQFPRWIAKAIADIMVCHESQVDVWVKAGIRRLTTGDEGRRLVATVISNYKVYNPNRGRNIGLGIGLGVVAPALGLGLGLGEGYLRDKSTAAPVISAPNTTLAPVVVPTAAAEEGSSMPLWAAILLALALLACIGAAVYFFGTQKKEKKKRAVKKAAPVVEEAKVVEEVVPMLAPPLVQTYQPAPVPAFQSVQYVQQAPVTYAAPAVQTVQAAPTVTYAAAAPAYTSVARGF